MKIFILLAFLSLLSSLSAPSQNTDISVQRAQKLMERIIEVKSERPGWDYPSTVIESGVNGLRKTPEFVQLQEEANTGWPQIIANIEIVAPTDVSKAVLFVAFQSLSEEDYLKFLKQAVGLTEAHRVNKQLLKWALMPMGKGLRGVVSLNYDKPITQDIIRRVKILYVNDGNMLSYYNNVLSGKTMREGEKYLRDNIQEPRSDPARRHIFHDLPESSATNQTKDIVFPLWAVFALAGAGSLVGVAYFFTRRKV